MAAALFAASQLAACSRTAGPPAPPAPWDADAARHLANRAGFGATPAELRAAVARGREAEVERLLRGGRGVAPFAIVDLAAIREACRPGPPEGYEHRLRVANQQQLRGYALWWIDAMLSGADPLRERMTLFWHGYFTTSVRIVRHSGMVATQHDFLRRNALGNFGDLLRGIVHDPAMLVYLDAHVNRAGEGNENFARELLELYSLGEGNYTERDVREVARALTGLSFDDAGRPRFRPEHHDGGSKTVLGREGRFGPDEVVALLLERPECARHVAGRMLAYLEGVPPREARLERYARLLRESGYELDPVLRALFLDPEFYRDEVVGRRQASPLDQYLGAAHRCRLDVAPLELRIAAALAGEDLFAPPGVDGWPRDNDWITTSGLMTRANHCGVLVGALGADDVLRMHAATTAEIGPGSLRGVPVLELPPTGLRLVMLRRAEEWASRLRARDAARTHLAPRALEDGVRDERDLAAWVAERGLAIRAPRELEADWARAIAADRRAAGVEDSGWLRRPAAEPVVRRALHRALASPAGCLH